MSALIISEDDKDLVTTETSVRVTKAFAQNEEKSRYSEYQTYGLILWFTAEWAGLPLISSPFPRVEEKSKGRI